MAKFNRMWRRRKGAGMKLSIHHTLSERYESLLKAAEQGSVEAFFEANRVAIRLRSLEDRLNAKSKHIGEHYEMEVGTIK